jgi:hypothetical protein
MKKIVNIFIVVTTMLSIFGCDKGAKTPEGLVKMYVNDVTSKSLDRSYFDKYTSGKMLETINKLSEKEFNKFIDLKKIKNAKVNIISKNCEETKCSVTYIIKYDVFDKSSKSFQSEVKKIASVIKIDDIWKISDVTNIKTYHEATTPINAMED